MHGGHGHSHAHPGDHGALTQDRAFAIATGLNVLIVVLELVYGYLANSMALVADAVHNASDIVALLLAWGAFRLAARPPSARRTYGFGSASVLAALANAMLLLVALGGIAIEAVRRFWQGSPVDSETVAWVALIAIAVNGGTALLFWRRRHTDLNIEGAFLHMATDAAVSVGVVAAALLIGWTGWNWLDPAISLVIVAIILGSTWALLKETVNLAMHAVPSNVDRARVERYLAGLPGVTEVHDLHIWALSTTRNALTAHLVRPGHGLDDALLAGAAEELRAHHNIAHTTLQVESGDTPCDCALARKA